MANRKLDETELRRRTQVHLRAEDLRILDLLVELEGGNRSQTATRAVRLYCERVEALRKLLDA